MGWGNEELEAEQTVMKARLRVLWLLQNAESRLRACECVKSMCVRFRFAWRFQTKHAFEKIFIKKHRALKNLFPLFSLHRGLKRNIRRLSHRELQIFTQLSHPFFRIERRECRITVRTPSNQSYAKKRGGHKNVPRIIIKTRIFVHRYYKAINSNKPFRNVLLTCVLLFFC